MRLVLLLSALALAGCTSGMASREARVQHLLERGDYRQAIVEIEHAPQSADWRFSLGLLYGYREIEEKGAAADFAVAIRTIREAAPEKEEARRFLSDFDQRGSQAFFAFPWAHMIGPFPALRRPQPQERPNQAPEPTPTSVTPPADAGVAPAVVVAHL